MKKTNFFPHTICPWFYQKEYCTVLQREYYFRC